MLNAAIKYLVIFQNAFNFCNFLIKIIYLGFEYYIFGFEVSGKLDHLFLGFGNIEFGNWDASISQQGVADIFMNIQVTGLLFAWYVIGCYCQ